jgi:hypothetical protein
MKVSVIAPIVFCASLVPCASATSDADTVCPALKPLRTVSCRVRRVAV